MELNNEDRGKYLGAGLLVYLTVLLFFVGNYAEYRKNTLLSPTANSNSKFYSSFELHQMRSVVNKIPEWKRVPLVTIRNLWRLKIQRRRKRGQRGGVSKEAIFPSNQANNNNRNVITVMPTDSKTKFNAFEKDGVIHIDQLTYPNADVYTRYTYADSILSRRRPVWNAAVERFNIRISDWSITRSVLAQTANGEFSGKNEAYNGVEYKYGYMITGIWTESRRRKIVKMNMETGEQVFWEAPDTHFPQEPIFVPRPEATAEDDGVIVIGGFNSETAKGFMAILDAKDMSLAAEVSAPLLTPIGIHNRFYPAGSFNTATQPVVNLANLVILILRWLFL